tara:strand:- start:2639 stop:3052 length:414 start_codon:yes stop_codon:yes gene_type:complete
MSLGSIVLNLGGKLVEGFFGGGDDDDDDNKAMDKEGFLRKEARDVARDEALFRWKQAHARQKEGARITAGNTQRTTAKLQETKYLDDIYQKMRKHGINVEEVLAYIVNQQKRQSNSHTAVADLDAKYTVADPDKQFT